MSFRRYWPWLFLIIPVVIGLVRLRFDNDELDLLPQDLPVVRGLKIYKDTFSNARELLVTVTSPDADTSEKAAKTIAETLRTKTNLVASAVWQPPWLESPAQAAELLGYMWLNQPPEAFSEMAARLSPENITNTLTETQERLATSMSPSDLALGGYDPFGLSHLPESASAGMSSFGSGQELFASADGKFRIIFVDAKNELRRYDESIKWFATIKPVIENLRTNGQIPNTVTVRYTGGPAFTGEIAGGMQHDMTESVLLTALIIAILFWIAHRRWLPMLWLLFLLSVILLCTIALGGLFFGTLNVVSLGFAGILLGLAVDYGVVHYQEAMAKPNETVPEIRNAIKPSIIWAAITTTSAFLVLNFGGLPGLGELGTTVAIGICLSAVVMLYVFLPPLFRDRLKKRQEQIASGTVPAPEVFTPDPIPRREKTAAWIGTIAFVVGIVLTLLHGFPVFDQTPNALRPRNSPAYVAADQIKNELGKREEPLWMIASGPDVQSVADKLKLAESALNDATSNNLVRSFTLPNQLWPQPQNQAANRATAKKLLAEKPRIVAAALREGFNTNSLVLTENIFNAWQHAASETGVFWPTNAVSSWILDKVTARTTNEFFAMGMVYPEAGKEQALYRQWPSEFDRGNILLSGWHLLGAELFKRVQSRFPRVLIPMICLVMLSLWLAFRRPKEILLSLAVMCLSTLGLLAVMHVAGWSWNLMNLMAFPLILGTGVDYSIFTQLALRRHNGNVEAAYHSVGRALLLCGGTAVAGFASLSLSSNAGMASLGHVCAIGIGFNMLISVYLLPIWWRALSRPGTFTAGH